MQPHRPPRKDRAAFRGAVANRDHVVKRLGLEFAQVLRSLAADIQPALGHRLHRQRVDH
jgi:hypothetical protein